MSIQRAYCSSEFFKEILKSIKISNPHKIAYEIMRKLCDIYIDLPKTELKDLYRSNEYFMKLIKKENIDFIFCADFLNNDFTNVSTDVYFVNERQIRELKDKRKKYGCLLVENSGDIHILERLSYKQYRPFCLAPKKEGCATSWTEVFDDFSLLPINAAVITDNYIFSSNFSKRKEKSLYSIIKSLIPDDLETDFHLTIFFNNGNGQLSKQNANQIISDIHSAVRSSILKVQIVAHTNSFNTHDREILTNYCYINSGTGFNVVDNKGVKQLAKGEIKSVFHHIVDLPDNMNVKTIHYQSLCWLSKIYRGESNMFGTNAYIVGDDFSNRLLTDIPR